MKEKDDFILFIIISYEMVDIGRHLVIKYETHQSELILF